MSDEHLVELLTCRVREQTRADRKRALGAILGVLVAGATLAGFILDLRTGDRVSDSASDYVEDFSRRYAERYAEEFAKAQDRRRATGEQSQEDAREEDASAGAMQVGQSVVLSVPDNGIVRRRLSGTGVVQVDARGQDGFDPVLAIYRMSAGGGWDLLAYNDDWEMGIVNSRVIVTLERNYQYELRVSEFGGEAGEVEVTIGRNGGN